MNNHEEREIDLEKHGEICRGRDETTGEAKRSEEKGRLYTAVSGRYEGSGSKETRQTLQ